MKSVNLDFRLIVILCLSLVALSFSPILVRLAGEVNAIALATWRTAISVLLIAPFYFFYDKKRVKETFTEPIKHINLLTMLSGVSLGFHFILWISSLKYTSVASASILVTIHPVLLIIAEQSIFKIKFPRVVWLGVLLSFAGSIYLGYVDGLATTQAFPEALYGDFLAFSAAVVFAIYFLISRKVRQQATWLGYVGPIYFWSFVTCLVIGIGSQINFLLPKEAILVALGMAVGPQFLGHGTMNYVVKFVSPTILSTTILVEPVLATLFGMYLFSEFPTFLAYMAMLIIITGVVITWFGNKKAA